MQLTAHIAILVLVDFQMVPIVGDCDWSHVIWKAVCLKDASDRSRISCHLHQMQEVHFGANLRETRSELGSAAFVCTAV